MQADSLNEISLSIVKFVCVLIFLLALMDMQDYVCHLKFVTSLVFLTLSLCQVGGALA